MSILALDAVTLARGGRTVLDRVDVVFRPGRITAVIGPNGAGKSTLLEVAAGLIAPDTGAVRLGDAPLARLSRRDLAVRRAYLPQSAGVEWAMTVERVIALGLTAHLPTFGDLPARWTPRIDAAMARFDLTALRGRAATTLSGGELARVMLARATVGRPEVLIVDEPTAGLDPRHAVDAGRSLRVLADEGCSVVAALHDLNLVARIADEVIALKQGRVLAAGPVGDTLCEAVLTPLYDLPIRVDRDRHGIFVRFAD